MKSMVLTHKNCSDISVLEIREILGIKAEEKGECVIFDADEKQLKELAYRARSIFRALQVVSDGKFEELSVPEKYLKKRICIKGKSHTKIEELAEKLDIKLDYKNPEFVFYLHFEDDYFWLGFDVAGIELDKREYRIFLGREKLTGTAAYCLLRLAGYKPGQNLLDPFCRSGIIAIEAALFATSQSPHFYSKNKLSISEKFLVDIDSKISRLKGGINAVDYNFRGVQATRKNAQIAGVLELLQISKIETEFLDTKFGRGAIDLIVTEPPEVSPSEPEKKFMKIYSAFFDNARFLLPEKGIVACICCKTSRILEQTAKQYKFRTKHKRTVYQGQEPWQIVIFEKQ